MLYTSCKINIKFTLIYMLEFSSYKKMRLNSFFDSTLYRVKLCKRFII